MKLTPLPAQHLYRYLVATSVIGYSGLSFAADYTWNSDLGGSYTGLWTDTTTDGWNGGPPVSGDTALIDNGTVSATANNQQAGVYLSIGSAGVLNDGGNYLYFSGGSLTLNSGTINVSFLGDGTYRSGGLGATVTANSGTSSINNNGANQGIALESGGTTFNGSGNLTLGLGLFNHWGGAAGLTKAGTGTLTLTGSNGYTGDTTVEAGTLSLGDGTNHTNLCDTATVTIDSGAILNLNFSGSDTVGKLIINGDTLSGGIYNSSHAIYGSYFTGSGSLEVLNYSGTWISTVDGNWGTSSNWLSDVIASGADQTATFNAATGVTVNVDSARTIGELVFGSTGYTVAGPSPLTLDTSSDISTITVGSGLAATISAKLASADVLTKAGTGTLTLSAQNDFSNAIDVSQGTLELATDWTFGNVGTGTSIVPGIVTVESGATLRAVNSVANQINGLTLNGGTVEAVGVGNTDWGNFHLTGNVTATGTSNLNAEVALRAANVDFFVDSGGTLNVGGVMHNGAYFGIYYGAPANVSKSGPGTLVLSATNTYTGNTLVDEGTLELTSTSQMQFVVTDVPASNQITGTGTATFDGIFNIDTSAVAGTTGYIWLLVDRTSLTGESFDANFSVAGFTPEPDGVTWTMSDSRGTWTFSETSGELTLDIGNDFDNWKTDNGVTGGENDDDDKDGLTNRGEYAFGLIPTSGSSLNPIIVPFNKATGTFSYTRRLPSLTGLTYSVWYSTDLAVWTEGTGAIEGAPVVNGQVETVPVTVTGSLLANPSLFIQVRAE